MKSFFLLLLMSLFTLVSNAFDSNQYTVDDEAVEKLFESSVQLRSFELTDNIKDVTRPSEVLNEKDPATAFVLSLFLGTIGVHRFYLGTKPLTGIGYILTCGGCLVVWVVDTVVLLIGTVEDDVSKYIDNPRYFMW